MVVPAHLAELVVEIDSAALDAAHVIDHFKADSVDGFTKVNLAIDM